jgi:hypothetical protein
MVNLIHSVSFFFTGLNLYNITPPKRVSPYVRADEAFSVTVCASRSGSQALESVAAGTVFVGGVPRLL